MTEYILRFAGFSKVHGICHVVVADADSERIVLVGDLEDNDGTSVLNATEEIGLAISELLFDSAQPDQFSLFEYDPAGSPDETPVLYRVEWNSEPGRFAMPTWNKVDLDREPVLQALLKKVPSSQYTFDGLSADRELELLESPEIERRTTKPPKPHVVTSEQFREYFAPVVEQMRDFSTFVADLSSAKTYATANSRAMAELASEAQISKDGWEHPVVDSQAIGGITLRAAADHVHTFAEAFGGEQPPMYGHLVLARAAFQASVVSAWLNDPRASYLERVKRGLCELLLSAAQQTALDVLPDAHTRVTDWLSLAAEFGWTAEFDSHGQPSVDGETRPSIPHGIATLLGRSPDANLGQLLWSRLSAVTDAALWGLTWAVQDPGEPNAAGLVRAEFGTWSVQVATEAYCIIGTLRAAADARAHLLGWDHDEAWRGSIETILGTQVRLLEHIAAGRGSL